MARVAGSHAVIASRAPALEGIPAVHNALARDAEVSQPVVLLLHAGVGHAGNT